MKESQKAPNFTLENQNGKKIKFSDYKEKTIVLYFYPKDMTPGCTKEACSFRDHFKAFRKINVPVFGVSTDSKESHKKFIKEYNLPFDLLSDPKAGVCKKYGVYVQKSLYGKTYMGVKRTTFIIEKGIIKKMYENIDVEKHAEDILNNIK